MMSDEQHPDPTHRNRLADETSAYLRQHMHNPVDWYPWGEEASAAARETDRPLLVSIGYSACHWCHVMERESFEDVETAALMNRLFVNVKVDREERPDVDQIYMDTVTGLHGHGGWPLTVFCTPDGTPFYAGTYYPPEPRHGMPAFRQVLAGVAEAWRQRRDEIEQTGSQILRGLARRPEGTALSEPGADTAAQGAMRLLQRADTSNGGFGGAPKFPTPPYLFLLLAALDVLPAHKAEEAREHLLLTCREMSRGGMYDQLGGGFHRYSVDAEWVVPHFEKMLYDQGQLLAAYAETWRRTGDDDLLWPIRETAAFLRAEMTGGEGGLLASLDADSEGEEGTFYVWTPARLERVLGAEAAAEFGHRYDVSERGNFERGQSVLRDLSREPRERFAEERAALLRTRAERPRPGTDRKRVASWNALAISGLARAGSLLDDRTMLADAAVAARFVLDRMHDEHGRLLRIWNQGRARVSGFLDDHAALLEALLDLHRAGSGDTLEAAARTGRAIVERFFEPKESDFFLTPVDGERLAHRPRSDHDGATPHSTGLATLGLLRLAALTGDGAIRDVAEQVLRSHAYVLERAPEAYPTLARAALAAERGISVAVVIGAPGAATDALAARARRVLAPEDAVLVTAPGVALSLVDPTWLAGRESSDGQPTAWICRGTTCSLPVTDPEAIAPLAAAPTP
ncbi:MAG: thioredoxin domain-containing protein [Myxococcota bacterium]